RVHERPAASATLWSHVVLRPAGGGESDLEGDVRVFDADGRVLLEIDGWRYRRLEGAPAGADAGDPGVRERLNACPPRARAAELAAYLSERLASTLGLASVDASTAIIDLGMDSMLAVELKNRVERELGLRVSLVGLLGGWSAEQLAAKLAEQ